MDKILFTNILNTEEPFNKLLSRLSIPINNNDRVHLAYKLVRGFEKVRLDPIESLKYRQQHNQKSEIYFALFDLNAIYNVLTFLGGESEEILKIKIPKILNGTLSSLETRHNSEPRNILFELLMLGYLRKCGLDAHLSDPNPDITVNLNGRIYCIECKRIFEPTNSSVKENVKSASKQLEIYLKNKPNNYLGIIALSVEPKQGKGLLANSEIDALESLDSKLKSICENFGRFWQDKRYIENEKIAGVVLHTLVITLMNGEDKGLSTGSYLLINNTHNPISQNFELLEDDFQILKQLRTYKAE